MGLSKDSQIQRSSFCARAYPTRPEHMVVDRSSLKSLRFWKRQPKAMVLYYVATDLVPAILVGLALCSSPASTASRPHSQSSSPDALKPLRHTSGPYPEAAHVEATFEMPRRFQLHAALLAEWPVGICHHCRLGETSSSGCRL